MTQKSSEITAKRSFAGRHLLGLWGCIGAAHGVLPTVCRSQREIGLAKEMVKAAATLHCFLRCLGLMGRAVLWSGPVGFDVSLAGEVNVQCCASERYQQPSLWPGDSHVSGGISCADRLGHAVDSIYWCGQVSKKKLCKQVLVP